MKKKISSDLSRRKFIVNTSLVGTAAIILPAQFLISADQAVISCAPEHPSQSLRVTGTVTSKRSGNWSDPATWGGTLPAASDTPVIDVGHIVSYDLESSTVSGMVVSAGASLIFHPAKSTLLSSKRNILLLGKLIMHPDSVAVSQTIRFIEIDESRFVGAGMDMLETDIGLWVMGEGQLDLRGASKTAWLRLVNTLAAGASSLTLDATPSGWLPGDEICIVPTEPPTIGEAFIIGFDNHVISKISGVNVTLDTPTRHAHPKVNNKWTAEVMNFTRNVRIEGTPAGNSHIFIRSAKPQKVQFVALRYMGPRKDKNGDGVMDKVSGRYGIHFHHSLDGSRGSLIEGSVIRDTANNAYVPHVSHGITFKNNIAYNVTEPAFWWDEGDVTNDTLWEGNIVALNTFLPRALDANDSPSYLNTGYELAKGDNNIARDNVAVGVQSIDSGCFDWEANNDGVWKFTGNLAHNSTLGLRVWQNNTFNHVIEDFTAYHNQRGISHGAYANSFKYRDCVLYGNGIEIKAASTDTNRVRLENITIDGAGFVEVLIRVIEGPLDGAVPLFMRKLTLKGHTKAAIANESPQFLKCIDVIDCTIAAPEFLMHEYVSSKEIIRVQPPSGGQPFSLSRYDQPGVSVPQWNARKNNINAFAPRIWGDGDGLKGEYFNSIDLTNPAFTRIDNNVSFYEWSSHLNYAITGTMYSARWTGKIQPQFSESYTFYLGSGGGHRLWIDGQLLIDSWQEHFPDAFKSMAIQLQEAKKYDIKLEYFNRDATSGMGLFWSCPSLGTEYVPQSQLYSPDFVPPNASSAAQQKQLVVLGTVVSNEIVVRSPEDVKYNLFDVSGRLLKRGQLVTGINFIQVSGIAAGVLILSVPGEKSVRVIKK